MTGWRRVVGFRLGGFPWWKTLAMVTVGVIMAFGMGLRHGGPGGALVTVAVTLAFAAGLVWWSHVRMRGD